jgi:hypothetical protein
MGWQRLSLPGQELVRNLYDRIGEFTAVSHPDWVKIRMYRNSGLSVLSKEVIRMRSSKTRAMIVLSTFLLVLSFGQNTKADLVWRLRNVPFAYQDIAFGNGTFVMVEEGGRILTSPDGKVWSESPGGGGKDVIRVAYANGIFIAWSRDFLFSSMDGNSWDEMGPAPSCIADGDCFNPGVECGITSLTYGAGIYVAVCSSGRIFSSPDGSNWLQSTAPNSEGLRGVVYGNGIFVAVGVGATALVSTDGIQWTEASSMPPETEYPLAWSYGLAAVVFGHGLFVAVGTGTQSAGLGPPVSYSLILTSPDGLNWTQIIPQDGGVGGGPGLVDVAYGNGQFVAVGPQGLFVTSRDGVNWAPQSVDDLGNNRLNAVSFGNNTFVSVGEKATILQSDFVLNNCAATLAAIFLNFPIIKAGEECYQAQFLSAGGPFPDGSQFQLGHAEKVADPAPFNDCEPPTLNCTGPNCTLHVPEIGVHVTDVPEPRYSLYHADFQLIQAPTGALLLKLISFEPF